MARDPAAPLSWTAPGAGEWALDRSHVNRPATPITQHIQTIGTARGTRRLFAEIGAPADALDVRFVNGLVYSRVRPLVRPDTPPASTPPLPVVRLLTRLHPEMRRRQRTATRTLEERPWRRVVEDWRAPGGRRDRIEAANLALQDVDLSALDDEALVIHAMRTVEHAVELHDEHFWLHGFDLGPIGFLLHEAQGWGVPPAVVIPLLEGASPSTSSAERVLRRIRDAVEATGAAPTTIAGLRAVSPTVAADVDAFLRLRGHLVVSRYDIDGLTLVESPDIVVSQILGARDGSARHAAAEQAVAARTAEVRARVPVPHRADFDRLLAEARAAMDLRDDNGPHTLEWPLGLIRCALREIGRRMVAVGSATDPEHALELTPDEIPTALRPGRSPGAAELAGRQRWRHTVDVEDAPRRLGRPEPRPPLEALPPALARVAGFIQMVLAEAGMDGERRTEGLDGIGIGTTPYVGTARIAGNPEDALAALEPGDVLVVPCTTPAFNLVVGLAGALVTAEGGALSHAAVIARELGLPAVIGAPRALADIPDGATVEVDPTAGTVRVLGAA